MVTCTVSPTGFISRDPIGYKGSPFDLYEFLDSSPLFRMDPSGKNPAIIILVPILIFAQGCGRKPTPPIPPPTPCTSIFEYEPGYVGAGNVPSPPAPLTSWGDVPGGAGIRSAGCNRCNKDAFAGAAEAGCQDCCNACNPVPLEPNIGAQIQNAAPRRTCVANCSGLRRI